MSNACVVRKAAHEDISWLVEESRDFAKFFDSKISLYNPEHLRSAVYPVLIDSHLLLVAEVRGERAGFIAGLYTSHFLNPIITTLTEILFWVTPQHRGSRVASMLLNEYTQWGRDHADWVTMALETNSQLKEHSLSKRGFHLKEKAYIMEVGV